MHELDYTEIQCTLSLKPMYKSNWETVITNTKFLRVL